MMRRLFAVIVLGLTFVISSGVMAGSPGERAAAKILKNLKEARPDFNYGSVEASPIDDIYQVQVENGPVLYVTKGGEYIFSGSLLKVVPGGLVDVREAQLNPQRKSALDKIPEKDKVVFSPVGKVKDYIHVFTDVDCGYCQKLHQEVPEINAMGIEVRYLAYPRAGISSPSYRKIAKAWCAEDRQSTMTNLKNRQKVDVDFCEENPVAEHFKLGNALGVRGTPAIVLSDGSMLPGYITAKQLAKRLGL